MIYFTRKLRSDLSRWKAQSYCLPEHRAEAAMKRLIDEVPWSAENIVVLGKTYCGDNGANYTYSGIHLVPLLWARILIDIKNGDRKDRRRRLQ